MAAVSSGLRATRPHDRLAAAGRGLRVTLEGDDAAGDRYMRRAALVTGSSGVTTMGKATMSLNVAPLLTATTWVVITSRTLALISTRPSPT